MWAIDDTTASYRDHPRLEIGKIATQELLNRIHGMPQQSAIINLGYQIHLGESI